MKKNMVMNMLEPQELAFFKQNKNYSRISTALSNGFYCTYTGTLCNKAKALFINKLSIKY